MSLLGKFIESIQIHLNNAGYREVATPFIYDGRLDDQTILIYNHSAEIVITGKNQAVKPGSFLFIPRGQHIQFKIGKKKSKQPVTVNGFNDEQHRRQFLQDITGLKPWSKNKEIVAVVSFALTIFNTIPFFPLVGMPAIPIPKDEEFQYLIRHLALEKEQQKLGKEILINNYMQEIMIHLFRYIESKPELVPYIEKLKYLSDKRLVDIVNYIQDNLEKDLSNKALSKLIFVSEDYVGQFFKNMTQRNLQDYVENQRLERAMILLKTVPESVLEIAIRVGFKDAAYFSRRFKGKFGLNATDIKRQKDYIV
jgi:AraC-like DNA-binding protein